MSKTSHLPTKPKPLLQSGAPLPWCLRLVSAASDHHHLGNFTLLNKELLQGHWGLEQWLGKQVLPSEKHWVQIPAPLPLACVTLGK